MENTEYLQKKREEALERIKPICEAFNINDYDYEIEAGREQLRIYDTRIGCSLNSLSAIRDELIGWIFVNTFCKNRSLGAFEKQTLNMIKQHWFKEGK